VGDFDPATGGGFSSGHPGLVTAKHVIVDENNKIIKSLAYRINFQNEKSRIISEEDLIKIGFGSWFLSESTDIAVRFIYVLNESDVLKIPQNMFLKDENVQSGTPAIILGFPMGLRSDDYATPILRNAIVALKESNYYIIDGFVFPGNSGGPILYMPTPTYFGEIKIDNNSYIGNQMLMGVISSYIPYTDTAISMQTKRPRITFEENSGLCIAIPSSEITKLLNRQDVNEFDKKIEKIIEKIIQ